MVSINPFEKCYLAVRTKPPLNDGMQFIIFCAFIWNIIEVWWLVMKGKWIVERKERMKNHTKQRKSFESNDFLNWYVKTIYKERLVNKHHCIFWMKRMFEWAIPPLKHQIFSYKKQSQDADMRAVEKYRRRLAEIKLSAAVKRSAEAGLKRGCL